MMNLVKNLIRLTLDLNPDEPVSDVEALVATSIIVMLIVVVSFAVMK